MKEASPLRQQVSGSVYSSTRDLDVVFEETEQTVYHQFQRPKVSELPSSRRPRAGTMPSFIQTEVNNRPSSSAALLLTIESGRHRSGSLNLPQPSPSSSFWNLRHDAPLSPSSEQLLQNDSDFSIARTMRSLGLQEEEEEEEKEHQNSLFHHQSPPEFHMPSRSLLSGTNRNRSYSVNATAIYENNERLNSNNTPLPFASPLEGFTRQQQNRPRASSMGRADAGRLPPPQIGLWTQPIQQRSSPLVSMREEDALSLGDSELLANIYEPTTTTTITTTTNNTAEKPYLNYSQSTPTFRENSSQLSTRSLWVGNIDHTITVELLTLVFSAFGSIESVRLLVEKECGFVNFYQVEDAVRAKEEVLTRMGGRIGACIVRIGFGKADAAAVTETNVLQPTRALWLGNIPGNTTPTSLQNLFQKYGNIESVRVLSHKNCGFINFESTDSAIAARDALLQNEIAAQGFTSARVGFAKIPPPPPLVTNNKNSTSSSSSSSSVVNEETTATDTTSLWQNDLVQIMTQFNVPKDICLSYVKDLKVSSVYFDSIRAVPELSANRQFDAARLRDMRKRADSASKGNEEAEAIAQECMQDIAEISSDYIGNTVVQRLFEKCSEDTKTQMLEKIGPHLAAISIHKNGTWATQKMIDLAKTPEQVNLISQYLKPYIPPLLLDQFGNYAVQCCLRLGQQTQFIFDAMVEKVMIISQGRFGARSMRGILESEFISDNQQRFVASSLCQNALALATNANGALLLSWLIESTQIDGRMHVLATRLAPHLAQLCVHKLGSQIIYKLINQTVDEDAQTLLLEALSQESVLSEVLADQVRGLVFIQKVLTLLSSLQKHQLSHQVCKELEKFDSPSHRKLSDLLLESES
ncbi:armadillo-type protein [Mucor mucedo]|uniref:armadillo-type protein n=1 Tax=Mucor mucedo TaxID=29922 RepID=UPI0022206311|nr:armadillo-type protein [Mucor mucedo]KAI7891806.1 armadillo-type protein [Mucor mucedo]